MKMEKIETRPSVYLVPNKRKIKRSKKPPPNAGARSPMNMKSRSLDPETSQGAERAQVPIVELSK